MIADPDDVTVAARANAAWCDAVCRSHGIATVTTATHWYARTRTPPGYPDAVTLAAGADPEIVLSGTVPGPGRSVKDSYADLDLAAGFDRLFDASWIRSDPDPRQPVLPWRPIVGPRDLDRWRAAHDLPHAFAPGLLSEPGLRLFAIEAGSAVVAGAAVNAVPGGVGISNVFTTGPAIDALWGDLARLAARVGTGPVWGYESEDDLAVARRAGFVAVAPLRVWLAPDDPVS